MDQSRPPVHVVRPQQPVVPVHVVRPHHRRWTVVINSGSAAPASLASGVACCSTAPSSSFTRGSACCLTAPSSGGSVGFRFAW